MTAETKRHSGGLGRGLAALIPPSATAGASVREIPVDEIRPNPDQPRKSFDPDRLHQLAASISEHGLLQPVVVVEDGSGYTLVAGERRWRAASQAGLERIPAVVRTANEQQRLVLALVENLQRSDLDALEEARAYRQLIDEFGLTQEQVGARVGRSRPAIANSLRILDTAPEVQQAVADGSISGGHARALASADGHPRQQVLLATVVARALSVRQTEALVATSRDHATPARVASERATDPDLQHMEARMREALGTKVTIAAGRKGGRISIAWYDDEDLGRLVDRLAALDR